MSSLSQEPQKDESLRDSLDQSRQISSQDFDSLKNIATNVRQHDELSPDEVFKYGPNAIVLEKEVAHSESLACTSTLKLIVYHATNRYIIAGIEILKEDKLGDSLIVCAAEVSSPHEFGLMIDGALIEVNIPGFTKLLISDSSDNNRQGALFNFPKSSIVLQSTEETQCVYSVDKEEELVLKEMRIPLSTFGFKFQDNDFRTVQKYLESNKLYSNLFYINEESEELIIDLSLPYAEEDMNTLFSILIRKKEHDVDLIQVRVSNLAALLNNYMDIHLKIKRSDSGTSFKIRENQSRSIIGKIEFLDFTAQSLINAFTGTSSPVEINLDIPLDI